MKKGMMLLAGMVLSISLAGAVWAADVFTVDAPHSSIGFAVKHLMVAKVTGGFSDFKGDIQFSTADLANSKFDFVIQAASIDTRNESRDKHLKSPDFFDAATYPAITFKTTKVEKVSEGAYNVTGNLTMKSTTKSIVIPVVVSGPVFNPMAKVNDIGIEAAFKINRQDYGVNWNKALDNGGVMVGDEVDVSVNLEAHQAGK